MSDTDNSACTVAELNIRDELEKIASLITASRQLMAEGRSIDLSAVEDRVRHITESVTQAPPELASSFKEHLEALLDILSRLQDDLELHHQALQDNLGTLQRRTASHAYGPSSSAPQQRSDKDEEQ